MINALCGSMGSLKSSEVGSVGSFNKGCFSSSTTSTSISINSKGEVIKHDERKNIIDHDGDDLHPTSAGSDEIQIQMDNAAILRPLKTNTSNTPLPPIPSSTKHSSSSHFDPALLSPRLSFPLQHQQQQEADRNVPPDNTDQSAERSLWELFADQLAGDFMISSPVRNLPPTHPHLPSAYHTRNNDNHDDDSANNFINYHNDDDAAAAITLQGHSGLNPMPMSCSPCPSPSSTHSIMMSLSSPSPLGPTYNLTNYHKGGNTKGLSPIHRVLMNSPTNQYMQIESLSLPALEFLDELDKDQTDFGNTTSDVGIAPSQDCFDLSAVPELLECLTMPNSCSSSRFCASIIQTSFQGVATNNNISHLSTQDNSASDTIISYQMSSNDTTPLLQQLQQERQHEKQQQQQQRKQQQQHHQSSSDHQTHQLQHQIQNMSSSTLMVPLSLGPEQVINTTFESLFFYYYFLM